MRFSDIPGNEHIKRALVGMADSGRVAHAMLLFENDGCGAFPLAVAYLQYLNCPHRHDGDSCGECPSCHRISKLIDPDMHFIFPTNTGTKSGKLATKDVTSELYLKDFRELAADNPYFLEPDLSAAIGIEAKAGSIAVGEAKILVNKFALAPVGDAWRAAFILQPEKMNVQTANKLLKIIEEPPQNTLFLMVTHSPEKVLQTIFSRCQSSRVLPLSKEDVARTLEESFDVDRDEALSVSGICGGSIGTALHLVRGNEGRERNLDIFSDLLQAILARDLGAALDAADAMSSLDSREKQKAFCAFAAEGLRKIFLLQQGLGQIAYMSGQEEAFFKSVAGKLPKNFSRRALEQFDGASALIDRNVAQKIVFCDLVDRLFFMI